MRWIFLILSYLVGSAAAFAPPIVSPLMNYGGRLTESNGVPLAGPVDVTLRFYDAVESGNLLKTMFFPSTPLNEGVFQVALHLTGDEAHTIFGTSAERAWVEVQAGAKIYPRQTFYAVPYALKVPIDDDDLEYGVDGRLSIKRQSLGDVVLGSQATLGLGTYDNTQESALTGPGGLTAADKGTAWFNSDINQIKYWNGTAASTIGTAGSGIQSFSGLPANNQFFAVNTTGTSLTWNSVVDTHTLRIPLASAGGAVSGGLISNSDYTTFSNKVDRSGDTMASLSVTGNVGIGTTSPVEELQVRSDQNALTAVRVSNLIAAGNTSAVAEVIVESNSSSGMIGAFPADWGAPWADRMVVGAFSNASGLSLGAAGAGQDIRFHSGSTTEAVRIDSSGNVGIGSTVPTAKLDVNGTVVATGLKVTTSPTNGYVLTGDAAGNATWQAAPGATWEAPGAIGATTPSTAAFTGVSIGTTTPGADLSFGSGSNRTIGVQTQATAGNSLTVQAGGTSGANLNGGDLVMSSGTANGTGSSKIEFKTASGGAPATSMTILGSGNVGIGTTSPNVALTIVKDRGSTLGLHELFAASHAGTGAGNGGIGLGYWANGTTKTGGTIRATGQLPLHLVTSTAGNIAVTVSDSGNVGIGTSTPSKSLTVLGSGIDLKSPTYTGTFAIEHSANNQIQMTNSAIGVFLTAGPLNTVDFGSQGIKGNLRGAEFAHTSGGNALTTSTGNVTLATTSGNVGIGTTAPATLFHLYSAAAANTAQTIESANATARASYTNYKTSSGVLFIGKEGATAGQILTGDTSHAGIVNMVGAYPLQFGTTDTVRMTIDSTGNVGIGTTSPNAKLQVAGTVIGKPATSNATATIDFGTGNLQYTTSNCGTYQLHNMKDGGSYTFSVQGAAVTTCIFNAFSDAGVTGLTMHLPPDHGATTLNKHTLYNFIVMGTEVYAAWTPGY